MVSSRSWKNSNFNRLVSLALCVGVAFLLLAGSVFAQGTTALAGTVNTVALQVGKANTAYTIPAGFSSSYTRKMGVARQAVSGNFFLTVTLPAGFTFNAGGLPVDGNLTLTDPGVPAGVLLAVPTLWTPVVAGATSAKYLVQITTGFTTAPTFTLNTVGWRVNDTAGVLSGTSPVTVQLTLTTTDANTGTPIDTGGVDSANFLAAVNGLSAAVGTTTATIDTAAGSARKNFVVSGGDTLTQDQGATLNVTVGNGLVNVHSNTAGAGPGFAPVQYQVAAGDFVNVTVTGNLSGVKYIYYNYTAGGGVAPEVRKAIAGADVTNGFAVIAIPGTNGTISGLANASAGLITLWIEVDGTTQLTTRAFTIAVDSTIANNAACNRNLVAAGTPLSTWGINGTVLMANWANANTGAWKSRLYLFNETSTPNATVIIRMFQIPISANVTAPIQVGNTVTLAKTMGAVSGMTVRLEDVITASGAVAADLAGPDNSYNVAVEITVYTQGVGSMVGGVTGYAQTFNLAGTVFTGTTPLSKIQ